MGPLSRVLVSTVPEHDRRPLGLAARAGSRVLGLQAYPGRSPTAMVHRAGLANILPARGTPGHPLSRNYLCFSPRFFFPAVSG
ncbi:hypothetical protein I79_024814 [Cricetulus griseus]|uniref:Uncharacterized protein n=1 Tax=Cricetulus griseus TaxID=10029 RepID=G3ILP3_CRIGR|nr:hypothetical protein I79_024814 [Cricetulus griseus]